MNIRHCGNRNSPFTARNSDTKSDVNPLGTPHSRCWIRLDQIRLKEPLCLPALEGSHFKMKNGPGSLINGGL